MGWAKVCREVGWKGVVTLQEWGVEMGDITVGFDGEVLSGWREAYARYPMLLDRERVKLWMEEEDVFDGVEKKWVVVIEKSGARVVREVEVGVVGGVVGGIPKGDGEVVWKVFDEREEAVSEAIGEGEEALEVLQYQRGMLEQEIVEVNCNIGAVSQALLALKGE